MNIQSIFNSIILKSANCFTNATFLSIFQGSAAKEEKEDSGTKSGKKTSKKGASANKDASGTTGSASNVPWATVPQEIIDMPVDPNEPTYCLCQQVSYGEMIGCDNTDCPIEWFHFGCMQLTTKPKGKWYCPKCIPLFKKGKK